MILLPIIIIPTVLRLLLHSIKLIALKIELVFLSSSEDKLVQHWTLNRWNWSTIRPPVQLSFCLWRSISTIYNNYHSKQPENKNKTNKWSANYKKKKNKTQATIKSSLYGLFSSLFLLLFVFLLLLLKRAWVQIETKRKTLAGRRLEAGSGSQLELLTIKSNNNNIGQWSAAKSGPVESLPSWPQKLRYVLETS